MSYCKKVKSYGKIATYETEGDVYRVVNYIADMRKCDNLIGGGNAIISAKNIHAMPSFIADQLIFVQDNAGGAKVRLYHIVISFDSVLDNMSLQEIQIIAEGVIAMYPEYQSVYTLHEDTRNYHLHILFNNISLLGSRNISYVFNILDVKNFVEKKVDEYTYRKSQHFCFRKKLS